MTLLLSKVRPGDVLVADGSWPVGDPLQKGTRGNVALVGSHLVWRSPALGIDVDILADETGAVRGLERPPLENAEA